MLQLQTIQTIQTNIPVKLTFTIQKERKNENEMISYIQSAIQRQRTQYQRYVPLVMALV